MGNSTYDSKILQPMKGIHHLKTNTMKNRHITKTIEEKKFEKLEGKFSFDEVKIYDYVEFAGFKDRNRIEYGWGRVIDKDEEIRHGRHLVHDYVIDEVHYVASECIIAKTCKFGHDHLYSKSRGEKICPWCDIR